MQLLEACRRLGSRIDERWTRQSKERLLSMRRIRQGCSMTRRRMVLGTAALVAGLSMPRLCVAQTCNASNNPTLAIAKTADLDFGTLGTSASAGTAVIDPATGARTVTGGVIDLG